MELMAYSKSDELKHINMVKNEYFKPFIGSLLM